MEGVNWVAVIVGWLAAFALGWALYGPWAFGRKWAEGTRIDPEPPASMPLMPMAAQLLALFLLALIVGMTATIDALGMAVVAILAFAAQAASVGAWAQKTGFAIGLDTVYAVLSGVVMIAAQGIF